MAEGCIFQLWSSCWACTHWRIMDPHISLLPFGTVLPMILFVEVFVVAILIIFPMDWYFKLSLCCKKRCYYIKLSKSWSATAVKNLHKSLFFLWHHQTFSPLMHNWHLSFFSGWWDLFFSLLLIFSHWDNSPEWCLFTMYIFFRSFQRLCRFSVFNVKRHTVANKVTWANVST